MEAFFGWLNAPNWANFTTRDAIDIILVAVGIYYLLLIIQGTRAMRIALGIIILILMANLSDILNLQTIRYLLDNFFSYLVIAIIILFQAEIRKALAQIGMNPFRRVRGDSDATLRTLEEVTLAASLMATKGIGGIIVIEKEQGLKNFVEAGRAINAEVNYDLILSIFNPASPLHDGALIIQDNRIAAASCFLPLTSSPQLSSQFGTRHRAAIGLTEETDAVAVIISEERSAVTVSQSGRITKSLSDKDLMRLLTNIIVEDRNIPPRDIARRTREIKRAEVGSTAGSAD